MRLFGENVLRWYGHVKKMNKKRLVKRIFDNECSGRRRVLRTKWMDNVHDE